MFGVRTAVQRRSRHLCGQPSPSSIPCVDGPIRSSLPLNTDGVLDLDISAIRVTGAVLINGTAIPAGAPNRGAVTFRRHDGGTVAAAQLPISGVAHYAPTLLPGIYDVSFDANEVLCDGTEPTPAVPCVDGLLSDSISLLETGVLNLDIPVVRVAGQVTLNGSRLNSSPSNIGSLKFTLAGGGAVQGLTPTYAFYAVSLMPGVYRVDFIANPHACTEDQPPGPCIDGPLLIDVPLMSAGVLDLDVPMIRVRGMATLNGTATPNANVPRGALHSSSTVGDRPRPKTSVVAAQVPTP